MVSKGGALPVVKDLKVLFFGLNNVWQPWMSEKHKPQLFEESDKEEGVDPKNDEIVSQEMTLSCPNEQQAVNNHPVLTENKGFSLESREEVRQLSARFLDLVENRKFYLMTQSFANKDERNQL